MLETTYTFNIESKEDIVSDIKVKRDYVCKLGKGRRQLFSNSAIFIIKHFILCAYIHDLFVGFLPGIV